MICCLLLFYDTKVATTPLIQVRYVDSIKESSSSEICNYLQHLVLYLLRIIDSSTNQALWRDFVWPEE